MKEILNSACSGLIGVILTLACQYFIFNNPITPGSNQSGQQTIQQLQTELKSANDTINQQQETIEDLKTQLEKTPDSTPPIITPNSINLLDTDPFIGSTDKFLNLAPSGSKDNLGNSYAGDYLISGVASGNNITYNLEGKYNSLSGTIALPDYYNDIKDGVWLEFRSSNSLLYETEHLYAGIRPVNFQIDITGLQEITIEVCGFGGIYTKGLFVK